MSDVQPLFLRKLNGILSRRKALLAVALVITSLVVTGFVWSNKQVNIIVDGKNIAINTIHSSPVDILAQADIYLGSKDEYRLSTPKVNNGTTIEVYRAVPITVTFQENTEIIITGQPTVGELAVSLGLSTQNSRTIPVESTKITPMMQVKIIAVVEKVVNQTLPVPPPVIRQPDGNLEKDVEETSQQGTAGVKEATVKLRFEDGQQVAADIVAEKVVTAPTPQIVRVGTRDTIQTSRGTMRFSGVHNMVATAYTPFDGSWHGITASGIPARWGVVAVDPDVIPLGTRLYIPGYGLALAADTGGDIIGNRIDLCMESHDDAWTFGRRTVKVYVIAE